MSNKRSPGTRAAVPDGLEAHLAEFLATLAPAGYAEKTQHDKRREIVPFIRWIRDARIAVAALDETCVAAFLARRRLHRKHRAPAALRQFLEYLRVVGVARPPFEGPGTSGNRSSGGRLCPTSTIPGSTIL